jgi:methyl-accepting chemotaxis protein
MTNEEMEKAIDFLVEQQAKFFSDLEEIKNIQNHTQKQIDHAMSLIITLVERQLQNADAIDGLTSKTNANMEAIERLTAKTEANTEAIERLTAKTEANAEAIENLSEEVRELSGEVRELSSIVKTHVQDPDAHKR